MNQRKGLELHPSRKVAKKIDLVGQVPAEQLKEPIDQLRNMRKENQENVEQLGDELIDERNCHVYRIRGAKTFLGQGDWKLWADAKTALPVKMHIGDEKTSLTFEQFVWDQPLDAALFSMEIPQGYMLEELKAAQVKLGRIYFHRSWADFHSIQPDGQQSEVQFLPKMIQNQETYVADMAELSPDGRRLAIGYTSKRKDGMHPPERVLLVDRTRPEAGTVEAYAVRKPNCKAGDGSTTAVGCT